MEKLNGIKINGYGNKWSEVDEYLHYKLLENDVWGDMTCYLVLDTHTNCIIGETYDGLLIALEDLEVLI